MEGVVVACRNCGGGIRVEYATDKRTLTCKHCGRKHAVTGLHIGGTPIIHLVAEGKKGGTQ